MTNVIGRDQFDYRFGILRVVGHRIDCLAFAGGASAMRHGIVVFVNQSLTYTHGLRVIGPCTSIASGYGGLVGSNGARPTAKIGGVIAHGHIGQLFG